MRWSRTDRVEARWPESTGIPLPGESLMIAAAIYAATRHQLNIFVLVPVAALHPRLTGHFNPAMPRKPSVPAIPAKPTGRTKPGQAQAGPKPSLPVEQFNLWDAFAGSEEPGEAPETTPPRPARTVRRKKGK
jgi:hypothetical protein